MWVQYRESVTKKIWRALSSVVPGMMMRITSGTVLPGSYTNSSPQLLDMLRIGSFANWCAVCVSRIRQKATEFGQDQKL